MSINELLAIVIPLTSLVLALLIFGLKGISAWERVQEKKDAEHIQSVVDLRMRENKDEFEDGYLRMMKLIKDGTFK